MLGHKALVPLQEFFTLAHDSPEALNPLGNNRWAKQAYAFVHMCLYGRDGRYQKPLALFVRRLGKEPASEALFTDCFKMSYKGMLDELRGYINVTDYKHIEAHVKLAESPPLVLRDATQAEVGRIKGEAFMLGGHPEKARVEFITPYIRGERDPRLLASLGIFEHTVGEDNYAGRFLNAAIAAKVERPEAYLTLAQIRYAEAMAKPGTTDGDFSPTQTTQVIEPLLAARQQAPQLQAVYELIADTWAHSAAKPKKEDIAVLVEGVRLFPHRLRLLYQTAVFAADTGMNEVAGPLVDYALQVAPDAKTKEPFEKLKAALPSLPAAFTPSAVPAKT